MSSPFDIPGREGPYLIEWFNESAVSTEDVLDLWKREDAVIGAEAMRRIGEVQLVTSHDDEGLVGLNSLYLERNPKLGVDLWVYRVFVAEAHRQAGVANMMGIRILVEFERRFATGEDTRGVGAVMRFENEEIQRYATMAMWQPGDFAFLGINPLGQQIRVRYFTGATVPAPGGGRGA